MVDERPTPFSFGLHRRPRARLGLYLNGVFAGANLAFIAVFLVVDARGALPAVAVLVALVGLFVIQLYGFGEEVHVEGRTLTWAAPFRTVTMPVEGVERVCAGFQGVALQTASRGTLRFASRRGLEPFVNALRARVPGVEVDWDPIWDRLEERPGRSSYYQGD